MRILYLSCHSILEYDEVKLLTELGHDVFSPGAYVEPANPGDSSLRPGIPGLEYDKDILQEFHAIHDRFPGEDNKDHLYKEFVDHFDCVIVMHLPRWIQRNWHAMHHKRVIWRTIGQSVSGIEMHLAPYRRQGMEIVRYSPKEANIPGQIGQDALIRFYKDPEDYGNWTGEKERVVTFAQHMQQRNRACNYTLFDNVTRPFDRRLFGPGNESGDWQMGKVPFEQLQEEMRTNRVYFYTGTHPASYTLNFIEAWMTGIPVVAIGHEFGNANYFPGHDLYEVHELLTDGMDGFVSDNPQKLQNDVRLLLDDYALAKTIGQKGRKRAIEVFGKETIKEQWRRFLG
jgi:hypothetical protein